MTRSRKHVHTLKNSYLLLDLKYNANLRSGQWNRSRWQRWRHSRFLQHTRNAIQGLKYIFKCIYFSISLSFLSVSLVRPRIAQSPLPNHSPGVASSLFDWRCRNNDHQFDCISNSSLLRPRIGLIDEWECKRERERAMAQSETFCWGTLPGFSPFRVLGLPNILESHCSEFASVLTYF